MASNDDPSPAADPLRRRRREFARLAVIGAAALSLPWALRAAGAQGRSAVPVEAPGPIVTRALPRGQGTLPVIGMGTWITFNVGHDPRAIAQRTEVLRAFFELGGGMIDSSPMYGSSEAVVGQALRRLGHPAGMFSATKVWTSSADEGLEQVARSQALWGVDRLDLEQVHNLVGWRAHWPRLSELKAAGRVRYLGLTTSHGRRHDEIEALMRELPLDFVQISYSAGNREAEARLLPLAAERGIAVIVNRPFQRGRLIDRLEGQPLPGWAADLGCAHWSQALLKLIVSHPAVTCAIPATSRVDHMRENMLAGRGPMPDAALRARMFDDMAALL